MGLLDTLLEKKDVLAYIDFRIKSLDMDKKIAIANVIPEDREQVCVRFSGRILELQELKRVVYGGTTSVKAKSKFYSERTKVKEAKL